MLKYRLMRADWLRIATTLVIGISAASWLGWGQANGAAGAEQDKSTVAGSQTANDLMLLAAKQNGLQSGDVGPWHLRASFKTFDEVGATTDEGAYEEFWVSSTKYKLILTGKAFTNTEYGTEKGILRVGGAALVPVLILEAVTEFSSPLPNPDVVSKATFEVNETEVSGIKLKCLRSARSPLSPDRTYCLNADKPFVRITSSAMEKEQILHNRILAFDKHFIAGDLQFVVAGRPRLTARLESIESLDPVDEAMFKAPTEAVLVPRVVNVSAAGSQGMLLKKEAPEYPYIAKEKHVTGTVVLQATIGKDGHIKELQVVSGPAELQDAAAKAVHHWLYRPYLLNGEPVDVRTIINVIFTLAR